MNFAITQKEAQKLYGLSRRQTEAIFKYIRNLKSKFYKQYECLYGKKKVSNEDLKRVLNATKCTR